jgi:hypothetical protein
MQNGDNLACDLRSNETNSEIRRFCLADPFEGLDNLGSQMHREMDRETQW